jgi:AraC-like DNA-binding protein/mannose-6-phosphate isomerase-like protein (cupin superfamily)
VKLDQVKLLSNLYEKNPVDVQKEILESGIDFSSIYQEIEMNSQYIDTHMDISLGDIPVNLHSHTFYEIIYVLSNSGTQYLAGTKRYLLQHGDIVIIPPGIGHKPLFPAELAEPYKRIVLWISSEFIEATSHILPTYTPQFKKDLFLLRTAGTPYEYIGNYFHQGLKESREMKDCWQVSLCGNTMQLLVACIRAFTDSQKHLLKSEKPELLDDVVSYIESHLGEKISLSDIAQRFYVSESTIGQTFQKEMHVSFYHYVTQRRLIAAKSMMLKENNLDSLSTKVGFKDYSTFYRAFKKEFGISPKEYRNLVAESQSNLI